MTEHTVAIVSFEGALKREIKRLRKELQKVDSLSSFYVDMEVEGNLHQGDVRLTYKVGQASYDCVKGDSLQACLDEFLRRKGWKDVHDAKLLSYEKIPSDDTDDVTF